MTCFNTLASNPSNIRNQLPTFHPSQCLHHPYSIYFYQLFNIVGFTTPKGINTFAPLHEKVVSITPAAPVVFCRLFLSGKFATEVRTEDPVEHHTSGWGNWSGSLSHFSAAA